MKKFDNVKECLKRLNEDELKYMNTRLSRRIGGDIGEVVEFVQHYQDIDKVFSSAENADEFFDLVDQLDNCIQQEYRRRSGYEQKEKTKPTATSREPATNRKIYS